MRRIASVLRTLIAMLSGAWLLSACTISEPETSYDPASLADSITTLVSDFLSASERLEFPLEQLDSAITWYTHGARLSAEEIRAVQDGNTDAIVQSRSVLLAEPDVRVLGRDAALAAYQIRETLIDTAGVEIVFPHAVSQVWLRSADGWRLAHVHVSSSGIQ